ncbi:MAG: glutathione S-transferase family protein [Sphingomonas sp.]|nr:glutathione S-transferase family protein [Sphingomonas sp.]
MTATIRAFESSPDRGRGLARDMPVRWAFEEVGQPYDVHLVSFREMKEAEHRALQPFGQIPTYEDGDLTLFESAAIILHVAEQHGGLLPTDANARARAIAWMFAAKSTVEPVIVEREAAILMEKDKDWYAARMPLLDDRARTRLRDLSKRLGDSDWLDGEFSAADVVMINVLRRPAAAPFLDEFQNLRAYVERGEARPAFKRAFDAQHEVFVAASEAAAQ